MSEKEQSFDELIDEIKENARRDRARLEKLCDDLCENGGDPEEVSMVSDSLTKSNGQLIEIAKIKAKKMEEAQDEENFRAEEADGLYNDIAGDDSQKN